MEVLHLWVEFAFTEKNLHYGDGTSKCHCTEDQIDRYKNKISGPLLDRIDMVLTVPPLPKEALLEQTNSSAESSEVIRERVF
jgi:magnesium chelatase family protein